MKAATFIARYLYARGVRYAFGHPGSDVMDLIAALEAEGVTFVLTHHENTGAYMAGVVGRLTKTPGVVLVTKGPGVTNVATAMGSAHLDRAPVILLSSHFGAGDDAVNVRQHIPAVRFYEPITKLSRSWTAGTIHKVLPRAVATAMAGYPGPVFLGSLASEQVKDLQIDDAAAAAIINDPGPADEPVIDAKQLDAAARVVALARRLVVVVGPGVEHAGARDEMLRAIDELGAPVCVTPEAVGWVPAGHPLYAGMLGWHDQPLIELTEAADVLLTVGLDGADLMVPYRGSATVVNVSPLGGNPPAFGADAICVSGDLVQVLPRVVAAASGPRDWGESEAARTRGAIDSLMAVSAEHSEDRGIAPQDVFTIARTVLPPDAIFTCDVGAHKIVAGTVWKSDEPLTFLISNGFGSMGFGLPSALGAKLVCPDKKVISVIGDGGFLMYAGDLATWARLRLPLTLVVMVDNELTQVKRRQERGGLSTSSSTFQAIDYVAIASSFGITGRRATTAAEFGQAIREAVAADVPTVVEAVLDAEEYRRVPGWR